MLRCHHLLLICSSCRPEKTDLRPRKQNQCRRKLLPDGLRNQYRQTKYLHPLGTHRVIWVQQYLVRKILVTDLTITLKSKTFIRIYAMQNGLDQPNVVRNLKDKVGLKEEFVVKEYPLTTHKEMMEFRVASMEQVEALRKELKKTYLQFLMKDYVKEHQKASVVTVSPKELVEVNADGKPKNDDDPDLIPDN